ncbi:OmpA family protein [Vibrio vulnificus]|uniref:OmpA family protein n=1 Tax=Vibrio vulnificus TaxID=672 RepID=UPI00102A4E04|nr:OmpA family protein [Vibrio vulnificus]RZP95309.1 OmpA family protein [Vibrio vulnificus]
MTTKILSLSLLSASLLSLSYAHASSSDVSRDGLWIGAGTGFANVAQGHGVSDVNTFNGKMDFGYDFNHHVGVYGSYDYVHNIPSQGSVHMGSVGLLGRADIVEHLSIFGKVGATYAFNGESGMVSAYGVGLDYQLTHAVSVRAGVDRYDEVNKTTHRPMDMTQFYWGMTYRFGQPSTPMVITETVEVIKEVPVEVIKEVEVVKEVTKPVVLTSGTSEKLFANNSSILMSTKSLEAPLEALRQDTNLTIRIVGYTDSTGSAKYNQWMSERRAKAVADYFINHGIDAQRITLLGKGEADPIASNNSELGRAQNRRVELHIK